MTSPFTLAVYTADRWEHVCPVVRLTGPAEAAGLRVIRGNEWEAGELRAYPERMADADVVVIQRNFPSHVAAYEQVLAEARRLGKTVVYELDDLLPELPEQHPDVLHYISSRTAILRAVVEADAVVGSTPNLCEYLRSYNQNAWLLPNYLDDRLWSLRRIQTRQEEPVILGYLGGHSHSYDLEVVVPSLVRVLQRYGSRVLLRFWGVPPPPEIRACQNVEYIDVGLVSYAEFAAYFMRQECDVFIAPLQDNLFNRCKSHIKFLEYSALGVPGVYSCLAPYQGVVVHGENGFLASTPEEWEAGITRLVEDPGLRFQTGARAQDTVREHWLLSDYADDWARVYRDIPRSRGRDPHPEADRTEATRRIAAKAHHWQLDLEQRVSEQNEEIRLLRHELGDLKVVLTGKDQAYQTAYGLYLEIMNSTGWKVMQRLFRLRMRFVPPGSRQENGLKTLLHAYGVFRREGAVPFVKGTARTAVRKLRRQPHPPREEAPPAEQGWPKTRVVDGVMTPSPAVAVVLVEDSAGPGEDMLRAWVRAQTWPEVELAVWDRSAGRARRLDSQVTWDAPGVPALCAGLGSRYVCLASYDLLQQDETYLETNLIALETETLAFTVNLRGHAGWAFDCLRQGLLPGDDALPLLRLVAAKDCLRDGFELDLFAWVGGRQNIPNAVGKFIARTTRERDVESLLPFGRQMPAGERWLDGNHLYMRSSPEFHWESTARILHPIETVLPRSPIPSDLPTVIMAHTFLAVGGAEQLALHIINGLKGQVRFIVLGIEALDPSLGTLADAFRQSTPYVYSLPDFLDPALRMSFLSHLVERFNPATLYIANGAEWLYADLPEIKRRFPNLRTANQVYDYQVGWINRYDLATVTYMDAHIGATARICQAYLDKGARPDQVFQIEHAIDPAPLDPSAYSSEQKADLKRRLGLPPDGKVVTFASRLHPQKRPMDFVELARRFASDPSVTFLMVGDGQLAPQVDEEIHRTRLKNIVRHKFYRPISDVLAVTGVLVLPSEYEGMPLIVGETQVMGKPVVVTDVGNNREVLDITGGGVVVPQIGDVGALASGVRQMLASPPDPGKIREAVISNYGVNVISQKYRRVLLQESHA